MGLFTSVERRQRGCAYRDTVHGDNTGGVQGRVGDLVIKDAEGTRLLIYGR